MWTWALGPWRRELYDVCLHGLNRPTCLTPLGATSLSSDIPTTAAATEPSTAPLESQRRTLSGEGLASLVCSTPSTPLGGAVGS